MALLESDFNFIDLTVFTWELTGRDESEFTFAGAVSVTVTTPYVPPALTVAVVPTTLLSQGVEELGVDVSTYPALSDTLALVSQRRAVAEMAYRRLTTPRGQLAFHPDAGRDLRLFLGESVTDARLFAMREQIEQELERDERVERAVAKLTFDARSGALTVTIEISTAEGPFTLTLLVTQLTVELLETPS